VVVIGQARGSLIVSQKTAVGIPNHISAHGSNPHVHRSDFRNLSDRLDSIISDMDKSIGPHGCILGLINKFSGFIHDLVSSCDMANVHT
jgi:hypothetical protein